MIKLVVGRDPCLGSHNSMLFLEKTRKRRENKSIMAELYLKDLFMLYLINISLWHLSIYLNVYYSEWDGVIAGGV